MITSKQQYVEYLEADRLALGRGGKRPGITDLIWRFQRRLRAAEYWHNCKTGPFGRLVGLYHRWRLFRLSVRCGYSIPLNACGKGLSLAHIGPVVMNGGAKLGEWCRVHICVNIGTEAGKADAAPTIGSRVYIGPGAKIFGAITIADGCVVGANAVVNKSFETPGVTIAGVPAKVVGEKGSKGLLVAPDENG